MLKDVKHTILDGQLGLAENSGTGVHIKIGVSPIKSVEPIVISGSNSVAKIREKLGYCPLADKVMESVEYGASQILCIPVVGDIDGTITKVTEHENSLAQALLTGSPYNAFSVIVKIISSGNMNTATFIYSIDGGYSYSEPQVVPINGSYELKDTGMVLKFGTVESNLVFTAGDSCEWKTTAPQMSNGQLLQVIENLNNMKAEYEYVHIVGECRAETWAAISEQQENLRKANIPVFFILEAYEQSDNQTLKDYLTALEQDAKRIHNYGIQIVATRLLYKGMDGLKRNINVAGIIAGLYGRVAVHKSIGETAVISISESKVDDMLPANMTDEDIALLDTNRYVTMRQYLGLSGYYITNARMMCADASDYRYAEDVRVLHKIIRLTRKEALLQLQSDVDMENPQSDLAAKAQFIVAKVKNMVEQKEISSVDIYIPEDQNILVTEKLLLNVRYVPRGKIREIEIELGVRNPYAD